MLWVFQIAIKECLIANNYPFKITHKKDKKKSKLVWQRKTVILFKLLRVLINGSALSIFLTEIIPGLIKMLSNNSNFNELNRIIKEKYVQYLNENSTKSTVNGSDEDRHTMTSLSIYTPLCIKNNCKLHPANSTTNTDNNVGCAQCNYRHHSMWNLAGMVALCICMAKPKTEAQKIRITRHATAYFVWTI